MANFRTIHHVDQETINHMLDQYTPVFILSTGRSGSKFIATLLDQANNVCAFHEPRPTLQYFSDYAYHHQDKMDILKKMIETSRLEIVLEVFIKDKIYMESNQCLTFFASAIASIFKNARFVHLIRHPGEFVRSAIRKGWHKNDSIWESGRVRLADHNQWARLDQIERLSWLWYATNSYIEDLKSTLSPSSFATHKLEDLISSEVEVNKLFYFAGAESLPEHQIRELQNNRIGEMIIHNGEPDTMKKVDKFPLYKDWQKDQKKKLKGYCLTLAEAYSYAL